MTAFDGELTEALVDEEVALTVSASTAPPQDEEAPRPSPGRHRTATTAPARPQESATTSPEPREPDSTPTPASSAPNASTAPSAPRPPDTAPSPSSDPQPPDGTSSPPLDPASATTAPKRRGADTRALTQVLFAELKDLEPGTPEHHRVRGALIEANLPLVRYAAARFRSRNEPMEDVVQVGTIGLINAIDRFDPDRGVQFPTFAMPTVVGEIKRYFRDNVRTVHVPRRLHELWVQVNSATEDLTTTHGRSPTTAEIAERLRISEEEVVACIEAGRSYHATSLEAAQEGDGLPGLLDRLGYEDPALDGVEHRDLVRHLLVQLPEREQRILLLRYYSNLTQSQISAELGVSQMHVSRLLARSFARLRSANKIDA
ncbi:SigB/SigF/SigG family RNA polymerase sigma factor [Streptomyces glomeratus]|uniref:RNA polymerase sigma-70 domain-containing protein n=1 Tax=Streptomyces glomeratus TaxID=284452 RepID=A0ABP6LMQ1_9ACTN|nr:SigB/SigF/SigG family RNA polymerase sigma factor [Streptomyces glomeratus]MCF1511829.1 SigB/SigF/SigG family RNA polymerase sigma factor [Streptomyces glomeratus]